jgi:FlaA1/EpsC-like NDP-sugar epimerase
MVIRNRYFFVSDFALTVLSAILAFAVRLDLPLFWLYLQQCLIFILLALVVKLPAYYFGGLYRRYWRYASVQEMLSIVAVCSLASLILAVPVLGLWLPLGWFESFPRSVLVIDWLLSLFLVGGSRFSVRLLHEYGSPRTGETLVLKKPRRVLIVGAGEAGALMSRNAGNRGRHGAVGYVDDNHRIGMRIRISVLGPASQSRAGLTVELTRC